MKKGNKSDYSNYKEDISSHKPELMIHSFFSEVAKEFNLKTEDVDLIYNQWLGEIKSELLKKTPLGVNMKGLGKLLANKQSTLRSLFYSLNYLNKVFIYDLVVLHPEKCSERAALFLKCLDLLNRILSDRFYYRKTGNRQESKDAINFFLKEGDFSILDVLTKEDFIKYPSLKQLKELKKSYDKGISPTTW